MQECVDNAQIEADNDADRDNQQGFINRLLASWPGDLLNFSDDFSQIRGQKHSSRFAPGDIFFLDRKTISSKVSIVADAAADANGALTAA